MVRRAQTLSLLIALGLAGGVAGATAPAASPALRQVEADQQAREQARDAARAQAEGARAEIAQLQAELAALGPADRKGGAVVGEKRLKLAALNVRESDLDAHLGGDQAQLARLLGALELMRRDPPPALFVHPHDVRDAVRAAILMRAITPELERRARALKAQTQAIVQVRRQVAAASEDLFTSESDVADRRAKLESQIVAKKDLEQQAAAEAAAADRDVVALSARASVLGELTQAGAAPATPAIGPEPPDPDHSGLFGRPQLFTPPVPGPPSARFEAGGGHDGSPGWTWRTADLATVVAPARAVVDYAGPLKGYGIVLILHLGGGYRLVLTGLKTALTAPGRMVNAGEPVGRMGRAATSAPELNFEIRKNGALIDPARWLKVPPATLRGGH
jgi:septal ring factor EnvC (AmiA/AmiB activator)